RGRRDGDCTGGAREPRVSALEPGAPLVPVSPGATVTGRRMEAIRTLHPAYFALVMATGIVSIAAKLMSLTSVALALFVVTAVSFAVLWILTAVRVARFPRDVLADLADHQRGVGFFTAVAATSVFGSQIMILFRQPTAALILWFLTLALWALLIYAV